MQALLNQEKIYLKETKKNIEIGKKKKNDK